MSGAAHPEQEQLNSAPDVKRLDTGDRIWFWFAEPPSELEQHIAALLFPLSSRGNIYHVTLLCWSNPQQPPGDLLREGAFAKTSLARERLVTFFPISSPQEAKLPEVTLTFTRQGQAGHLHISPRKIRLDGQTLIIIASKQDDFDDLERQHVRASDAIGYLSLILGRNISSDWIISSYFSSDRKKFVNGALEVRQTSELEYSIINIPDLFGLKALNLSDRKSNIALWLAGRAFASNDSFSSIVLYYTSFKIILGKRLSESVRNLYRLNTEVLPAADDAVRTLKALRDGLVHQGRPGRLTSLYERKLQAILLDALVYRGLGGQRQTALERLLRDARTTV
jgi:hypothetical protein